MNSAALSQRRAPTSASRLQRREAAPPAAEPATLDPVTGPEFDRSLDRLGPFERHPHVAVAVSGGADSLALAYLARAWAIRRGGRVHALVVDHGIRPEAASEATQTLSRLASIEIGGEILSLNGLRRGPSLAERARTARYDVLERACARLGVVHLLLGHHADDQSETILMRQGMHSGSTGLAGMAALRETRAVRVLRPLLGFPKGRLRATVRQAGLAWIEDPSNTDPSALRASLREQLAQGGGSSALLGLAAHSAQARRDHEAGLATVLARRVQFRPEGFALISPGPIAADALGAVLAVVAGRIHNPGPQALARLGESLAPATLGGSRILPAGRWLPGGWLVVREEAAMEQPRDANSGMVWDGRWLFTTSVSGGEIGALGEDAAAFRRMSHYPSVVLRTLPALRKNDRIVALAAHEGLTCSQNTTFLWSPPHPAACALFKPSISKC